MFTQEQTQWQQQVNPATGRPFSGYGEYSAWAQGQERQSAAAGGAAGKAGAGATPGSNSPAGKGATNPYDWGGTEGYYQDPESGNYYFGNEKANPYLGVAPGTPVNQANPYEDPGYAYQAGATGAGSDGHAATYIPGYGYINPKTGQIVWNEGEKWSNNPLETASATYDATKDYGLGPSSLGVIPIAHDASGTPTAFYAGTPGGGGKVFNTLEEAQAKAQEYGEWYATQHPPTGGAGGAGPTQPRGSLMDPLQGENYFKETEGFYKDPTEASQVFGKFKDQPTASEQNWNAFSGQFNQPSDAESLWGNYKEFYSDPNSLHDYYGRALKRAEGGLAERASAGGWGDSSAVVRAAGGLNQRFADAELMGMENFAKTGMGLAQGSDAGRIGRANTASGLAGLKDAYDNARVSTAATVDNGDLARVSAGQVAANSAQTLTQNRTDKRIATATTLGNEIATLTATGMGKAEADRFMGELQALAYAVKSGEMLFDQAMAQAQETAGTMGAVMGPTLNALLMSKLKV